jgi:tetratricopeptide (TPR) repeat protein
MRKSRRLLRIGALSWLTFAVLTACSGSAADAAAAGAVAEQHLSEGNLTAAREAINEAIAERDDIPELHLIRGRIEVASGAINAAYKAYSDALALDPANSEALQAVSQLGLRTGDLRGSLEATERILALAPEQPDALLTRGVHSLIRRQLDEAISYADRILSAQPAHENASILKARALFMKGEPEAALDVMDARADGGNRSAGVLLTRLEIFRELRRSVDMEREFELLRQVRPDDQALRLDEANFRFKLEHRQIAHDLITRLLTQENTSPLLRDRAIRVWQEYGVHDLPSSNVEIIRSASPSPSKQAFARFLIEEGKLPQANAILRALSDDDRRSLSARLLAKLGKYEEALRVADSVLARDETECDALIARSEAQVALGRSHPALRWAQRAASECPTYAASWIAAVKGYEALGRLSGVERIYSQALSSNRQNLQLTRGYAEWLLKNGRGREAVAIARRLTREAPALVSGWKYYMSLCARAEENCEADAARGLADARTRFGIDLEPGTLPPNGLFGRFVRR